MKQLPENPDFVLGFEPEGRWKRDCEIGSENIMSNFISSEWEETQYGIPMDAGKSDFISSEWEEEQCVCGQSVYTQGSLAIRFDGWAKTTLQYLVRTEVRTMVRRKRRIADISLEAVPPDKLAADLGPQICDAAAVIADEWLIRDEGLARALGRLSPQRRQVIVEMFYHRLSLNETAETMNLQKQTVANYKAAALKELRNIMEGEYLHEKNRGKEEPAKEKSAKEKSTKEKSAKEESAKEESA